MFVKVGGLLVTCMSTHAHTHANTQTHIAHTLIKKKTLERRNGFYKSLG